MTLRYDYNLPWRGVVVGTLLYAGSSALTVHLAKDTSGVVFVGLIALSAVFAFFSLIVMIRRVVFPQVLELTEDSVLLPHGFPRTRITRILYADIIRMSDLTRGSNASFGMFTSRGNFEIGSNHLPGIGSYDAVRDFICSKTSIVMTPQSRSEWRPWGLPEPIIHWVESEDLPRYRTSLVRAKPLLPRLFKAVWFLVRCFGFLILPWLLLHLFQLDTISAAAFLCLSIPITFFFTGLHWLNAVYPARRNELSFRERGISLFSGKQFADFSYQSLTGWAVVERRFEGGTLHILLLQRRAYVGAYALPDSGTREGVEQLLHDKKIPQLPDLRPSWEERG